MKVTSFPFRSNGFLLGKPSSVAGYPSTIEAKMRSFSFKPKSRR